MELFPRGVATDQTAPRRPFPVQSQGISSHSLVALARTLEYFLPLKLWPSRLLLENKSCQSRFDFTYCSSGFVFAFGDFSFLWQLFMFQKISKAATLFRYFTFQWGHVITHSSRQEWHQRSHRLDHIIWQIWDVILIFIWSNQGALFSATFPCQISFLYSNCQLAGLVSSCSYYQSSYLSRISRILFVTWRNVSFLYSSKCMWRKICAE